VVDRQSVPTRFSAGRSVFSRDLSDLLLVIECDDELVKTGFARPRQTSIGDVIVDEGEYKFFVVLIHQYSEFEPRRRRWSILER
jgi:hypothetical protein